MDSVSNSKKPQAGLNFPQEPFTIVINEDSDTPDPAPLNRIDSSKIKSQNYHPDSLVPSALDKLAKQTVKPQLGNSLLGRLSEAIHPEILNTQRLPAGSGQANPGPSNRSNPATPMSQKVAGLIQNQAAKFQNEDFKKLNNQLLNKAELDKIQLQKPRLPDVKKPMLKPANEIVILDDDQSDEEVPKKPNPGNSATSSSNVPKEVKKGGYSKMTVSFPLSEMILIRKPGLPIESASSGNGGSKPKPMKEDLNDQRAQKKPVGTRVRLEDKIQNLQGLQGSSTQSIPAADPHQNTAQNHKALNDYTNAVLASSLLGLGPAPGADQSALMKLNMMQYPKNYNPLQMQMQMQMLLNPALQGYAGGNGYMMNPEYVKMLQMQMQMLQLSNLQQQQQQQQQMQSNPLLNPLMSGMMQEMTRSKSEQEKLVQAKPLVKESSNKAKPTEEVRPSEVIHIVDDETDKEDSKQVVERQKAKSMLSKNNLEKLVLEKDKGLKPVFQIKQQKAAKGADGDKEAETKPEPRVVRRERQIEGENGSKEVKKPRILPKQTEKKINNEQQKAKGEEESKEKVKEGEGNALEENLEMNKKKVKTAKPQVSVFNSYMSEKNATKERRKNRLQVMNQERNDLEKEFKVLASKTEKVAEEDEEMEEHVGEITHENRTEWLLKPKSKKKIKIGPNYQAMVLPMIINDLNEQKQRKFKCMHNPDEIEEERFNTIAETAKNVVTPEGYNQDFVLRILRKSHLDYDKTANVLRCNEYFFSNLMKVRSVPNIPKKVVQPQVVVVQPQEMVVQPQEMVVQQQEVVVQSQEMVVEEPGEVEGSNPVNVEDPTSVKVEAPNSVEVEDPNSVKVEGPNLMQTEDPNLMQTEGTI